MPMASYASKLVVDENDNVGWVLNTKLAPSN